MSRVKEWQPHGTVKRYRQGGCDDLNGGMAGVGARCADCKSAMSQWNSQRGAGIAPEQRRPADAVGNVTSMAEHKRSNAAPTQSNSQPNASPPARLAGATERAVLKQLAPYQEANPIRYELALSAARILDDPERTNIHDKHSKILEDIVEKLTAKKKTKSGGRLATVSAMAGRRSASGL